MENPTDSAKNKMQDAFQHFQEELKKVRTGRANSSMLDSVMIEVYGQSMPLNHAATVAAVDAQLIQITPFDPNNLEAITAAIRNDSSLGLNPADDGKLIRIPIPPLTQERREQIVKQMGEKVEDARISIRNGRGEALKTAKQQEKDKEISQDDYKRIEKQLNELAEEYNEKINIAAKEKEAEIMKV